MLKSLLTFVMAALLSVSVAYAGGNPHRAMTEIVPCVHTYVALADEDKCVRFSCDYQEPLYVAPGYHTTLVQFDLGCLSTARVTKYELVVGADEVIRWGDADIIVDGVHIDTITMAPDTNNFHLVEIPAITKDSKILIRGVSGGFHIREVVLRVYFKNYK